MPGAVIRIPFGDFLALGEPDTVGVFNVIDEFPDRADSPGLSHDIRLNADDQDAS